jgi:hypothetical protein
MFFFLSERKHIPTYQTGHGLEHTLFYRWLDSSLARTSHRQFSLIIRKAISHNSRTSIAACKLSCSGNTRILRAKTMVSS